MIENVEVLVLHGSSDAFNKAFEFINNVDKTFPVPISDRVDIVSFTKKILERAIILQAVIDDEIVGLSSFYANDFGNMKAYLTFIAVKSNYMNMGIASKLIIKMFVILKDIGMVTVEAITDENNNIARTLYEKLGFKLAEAKNKRIKYTYHLNQESEN